MTKDHENEVWYSFDSSNLASRVLGSHDSDIGWQAGNEIRFGATMPGHNMAWEVVFWGLYGEQGQKTVYGSDFAGSLSSSLDFSGLNYDNGTGDAPVKRFLRRCPNAPRIASL